MRPASWRVRLVPPPLMKPQALLVVLLAAVVLVGGYFLFRGGDDVVPANLPGGPASSSGGAQAPVNAESADGGAGGERERAEDALTRTTAAESKPGNPEAKAAMLRGRIVDLDGEPRANLALAVDTWPADRIVDFPAEPRERNSKRDEITTAADGTFALTLPAQRQGTFSLPDDELVFGERVQFVTTGSEQDLGNLLVVTAARIQGVVKDQDGNPAADVMVAAEFGMMGFDVTSNTRSAEDGTFSVGKLRPGQWQLTTRSSRFLPTARKVELEAAQQLDDVVIVVKPGRAIAGQVVDDRGVGVPGMKVASRRKQILEGVDIERFTTDEAAITDAQGNFRLAGLEGRTATIRATGDGHTSVTQANVETDTSNVVLRVQRLGRISGVLVTRDGDPIVGSRISVKSEQRTGGAVEMAESLVDFDLPGVGPSATTDEQGRFELDGVRPGTMTVRARGKTHLPIDRKGVRVGAAETVRDVRLLADAGAVARIQVVDQDGKAIAGAKVSVRPAPKPQTSGFSMTVRSRVEDGEGVVLGSRDLGSGTTDEQGVATIMGLPGGDAVVSATHASFAPTKDTRVALPASGSIDRQLSMAPPSYVEVTVLDTNGAPSVGTDVLLELPEGEQAGAAAQMPVLGSQRLVDKKTTDAEGKVHFGPVAAREYVVSLSRGKQARGVGGMMVFVGDENDKIESSAKTIRVAVGKTTAVELHKPILATLTGVVMGSDGPVVGCGVELTRASEDAGIPGLGGKQKRTDENGRFTFEGVESGDYVLRYGKPGQVVKARAEVTVPANTTEVLKDLVLRTGTVRVLVLSKDDAEPVERAEVRLTRGGERSASGQPRQESRVVMIGVTSDGTSEGTSTMTFGQERVLTDEDGIAEFEDVPVGDYTLKIESRKYSPAEKEGVSVVELQLTDCGTIELAGAGQIRGSVKDAKGKPAMAMVEHRLVGTEQWSRGEFAMRGSYRITGVAPGRYEVRARSVGSPDAEPTEPKVVEVEVGKTEVADFQLQ